MTPYHRYERGSNTARVTEESLGSEPAASEAAAVAGWAIMLGLAALALLLASW